MSSLTKLRAVSTGSRRRPIGRLISMFPCRSSVSRPPKILPLPSSISASSSRLWSGNVDSSISSISLSAATKRVRSTVSAQDPSYVPMASASYMPMTSAGISRKFKAAMFKRPLVRAAATRARITLACDSPLRFWLKGSRPKSNVVSVGMTGAESRASAPKPADKAAPDVAPFSPESCCEATRLAAFARAICSRSAAEDFWLFATGLCPREDSAGSLLSAVEAVDALEAWDLAVPARDAVDARDAREVFRVAEGAAATVELDDPPILVIDGLRFKPVIEARDLSGRAAVVVFAAGLADSAPVDASACCRRLPRLPYR